MEALKLALSMREASPQVQQLLDCLRDPSFDLDVYICSVGGVGSTELSNFLTRHGLRCNLLRDQDGLRHANSPPPRLGSPPPRVVYLYGDPLASVASHYRRGIAEHQALKTGGAAAWGAAAAATAPAAGTAAVASGGEGGARGFPQTFEDFVERGEDLFGYAAHLENWLTAPVDYDVFFARYERAFDGDVALPLLLHACGPKKTPAEAAAMAGEWCASRRARASVVPEAARARMYVELAARIKALPAAFLRRAGSSRLEPRMAGAGGGGGDGGSHDAGGAGNGRGGGVHNAGGSGADWRG